MKLDIRAAALAAGSITVLVYTLCTVFCVLVPESTLVYVTAVLFHFDASGLYRDVTWGSFIVSLLGWGLGMAFTVGATAWIYNRLARMDAEKPLSAKQREFAAAGRAL
jgi:uncharacterized membrane protein YesL